MKEKESDSFTVESSDVRSVAESVYNQRNLSSHEWPDCWNISQDIIDRLVADLKIPLSRISIIECYPTDGYEHYVVEVKNPRRNDILVDGSYNQFSYESDTPVSVASADDIKPIVVAQPPEEYVFYKNTRRHAVSDY